MAARPELLLVNHFALDTVCGTTVMFGEMLRIAPRAAPGIAFAYESHEPFASPEALRARLDAAHAGAACVVAINAQIEVGWASSEALFAWCRERGVPAFVYAHDYWPQHRPALETLVARHGARVIASTPFVADAIRREGFDCGVVDVGVPLPDAWPSPVPRAVPPIVASAGRLVPRKRLADVVRGFAASGLDGRARLYLRLLPSQVFGDASDRAQLEEIEHEIAASRLAAVTLDRRPGELPDYATYSAYACTSSYEGFGMPVIEAAFHGCPPLMSDIPPHRRSAEGMFGAHAQEHLFPVGDWAALGALLRDEILTGRRAARIAAGLDALRRTIEARWSLAATARALGRLALDAGR